MSSGVEKPPSGGAVLIEHVVRTALDTIGILLIAAGIAAFVHPWLGWGCLLVAGVVLLAGSFLSAWLAGRAQ